MSNGDFLEYFFNHVWFQEKYKHNLETAKARLNQLGCYKCSHRNTTVTLCNSIIDDVKMFPECPFCNDMCNCD